MPVEISPAEYVAIFEGRMPAPPALTGVCGRVVRGKSDAEFSMLSFASGRRLAWVMGPDGLRAMIGLDPERIVLSVGKDEAWLREKLSENMRWRVVVLPRARCMRADWNGVFATVVAHYPEIAKKLLRWSEAVQDPSLSGGIDPRLVVRAVKDNATHPQHMSVERYLTCEDTVLNARLFLWHSLGVNQHFVGNGWATDPATGQSVEEYLTANVPLANVLGHRIIDLDVA